MQCPLSSRCDWNGSLTEIEDHLKTVHATAREPYNYWQNEGVPFFRNVTHQFINVIDAFNKKFIIYYRAAAEDSNVSFLIFLLGRKIDAQKYIVDFEVKEGLRKIKFVDHCNCESDDLEQIIAENRCITVPKGLIETYLVGGKFNIRFTIKKKEKLEDEDLNKERYLKEHILKDVPLQTQQKVKDILKEPLTNIVNAMKTKWKLNETINEKNLSKSNFSPESNFPSEITRNDSPSWRKNTIEKTPVSPTASGSAAMPSADFANKFLDKFRNKRSVRSQFRR